MLVLIIQTALGCWMTATCGLLILTIMAHPNPIPKTNIPTCPKFTSTPIRNPNPKRKKTFHSNPMPKYNIVWSPEGRTIATVDASSVADARKQTPMPYRQYMGEVYAEEVKEEAPNEWNTWRGDSDGTVGVD